MLIKYEEGKPLTGNLCIGPVFGVGIMTERMAKLRNHLRPSGEESPILPPEEAPVYITGEAPLGMARNVRIVTIGAGVSSINMIRALRKHVTNYEHVVYEKNPTVGGT